MKILYFLEMRIKMLWSKSSTPSIGRVKRGILEQSSFEFPPETALITISFLTFSVFLIKLVLVRFTLNVLFIKVTFHLQQVINVIKSKHYNMNGMAMITQAPGTASLARSKLNARQFGDENEDNIITYEILSAIEK